MFKRKTKPCPDLYRSPEDLLAYAAIPACLRPHRTGRHKISTVNTYVDHLFNVLTFLQPPRWALPWDPDTVVAFMRDFHENQGEPAPKVVAHLTAINSYHVTHGFPSVYNDELSAYITDLRASHTPTKASPATPDQVRAMVDLARMGRPMKALQDAALLLLAFAHGLRPSQLCRLRREHLMFSPEGMRINIGAHKGAPHGERPRQLTVARATSARYCPVVAMEAWLEQEIAEHVFVRLGRIDRAYLPLDSVDVCRIVREYGKAIGAPGKFTAYSLRRGFASQLKAVGVPLDQIRDALLHRNDFTTRGYIDELPVPFSRSLSRLVLP